MSVPDWVYDAIIYQIFPDRFADGDTSNNPVNVQPWGSPPTTWGFQGGDLKGILQRFDYLLDLGITVIYLNPIFRSSSNHRYNTYDYYQIDPKLGDQDDFRALVELAHKHNMRVVLDGVFNHCGRGFFAFNDLLENQEYSPYRDWYHVKHFPVEAYSPGPAQDYLAWWEIKSLPKFNTDNHQVRQYLWDVGRYWILQGADGWRLDVPNEINDDSFWAEFRRLVKEANPAAYLLGEIWTADRRWVGEKAFDGLMNYPFRDDLIRFIHSGTLSTVDFVEKIETLAGFYPAENTLAMYNLLSSHDTERVVTKLDGDIEKTKLAFFCQFSFPGVPGIYYGDEIGLAGGKDPDSRRAFPWDESQWEPGLRAWVKQLISIRKQQPALRRGALTRVMLDQLNSIYAFLRGEGDGSILAILNASPKRQILTIPPGNLPWGIGQPAQNLFNRQTTMVNDAGIQVELEAWGGAWLAKA